MPCRALEAFRPKVRKGRTCGDEECLNALSGIGGVQTEIWRAEQWGLSDVLMPCRALEAFRHKK